MAASGPGPGWHIDPAGQWRWWDGSAWGEAAPASPPDRRLAMYAHLGVLVGGFVVPLIIFTTFDRRDTFLRANAAEAANFGLTYQLATFGIIPIFLVFVLGKRHPELWVPWAFMGTWAMLVVIQVALAAQRSRRGAPWRYPLRVPLVRP